MGHESHTEDHPNRYGNPSPPLLVVQQFKHVNFFRKIAPMPPNENEISHGRVLQRCVGRIAESATMDHHDGHILHCHLLVPLHCLKLAVINPTPSSSWRPLRRSRPANPPGQNG